MEKERSERTFEMDHVIVQTDYSVGLGSGRWTLRNVEEVMYAERFVLITNRDADGLMVRRTFPYEHLVSIVTTMKPDMPVLEGEDEDVQDEVGDKPVDLRTLQGDTIRHYNSSESNRHKPYPASDAMQALRDLGITVSEDR